MYSVLHDLLIASPKQNAVKIGYTQTPDAKGRLSYLQAGNPEKLTLLCQVEGSRSAEAQAHAKLAKWRLVGEWFELSDEVREFVAKARALEPGASLLTLTAGLTLTEEADLLLLSREGWCTQRAGMHRLVVRKMIDKRKRAGRIEYKVNARGLKYKKELEERRGPV